MFDLTVHKSPRPNPHVKVTVVLVDRGTHKQRALEWLTHQTLSRTAYELIWIELHDTPSPAAAQRADWVACCNQKGIYHLHKGLNAALMLATSEIVTFCDAGASGPQDFIQSVVDHFIVEHAHAPSPPTLLRHRAIEGGAGAVSMPRTDAIRFGGFDEHPLWRNAAGSVDDLIGRMQTHGVSERWHERIGLTVPLENEPLSAAVMAQNAERAEIETFAQRRMLPMAENLAIRAMRVAAEPAATPSHVARPAVSAKPTGPLDWRDIPVFIVNRNRCAALQRLVAWLLGGGTRSVVILDNASTYPPLLSYYEALPAGVQVTRLAQNFGPYVLWQQGVHRMIDTPYVVTDSDVVPASFCPSDLIGRLLAVMQRYPDASKVGPALRIDDLPDAYVEADTVRKWESQFWEHPVAPGVFAAPIDTTFALYPAKAEFSNDERSLRLGHPCIAEHTPWYAEEHALSEEERYYREHTSTQFSNWSVVGKTRWVERSARVLGFEARARVLNLDGQGEAIPGWTNAAPQGRRADLAFDWTRAATERLPVPDNHFDGIRVNHVLEEVRDAHALLAELHRVAKPGARLQLRVAHGTHAAAWADPATCRAWGEGSFGFFAQPGLPLSPWVAYHADWSPDEVRVIGAAADTSSARSLLVTMTAVKPARARSVGRHAPAVAHRVADDRLDPGFAPV